MPAMQNSVIPKVITFSDVLRIPAKGTCPEQIHLCHFSLVNLNLAFAKPIIIKLGVNT